MSWAKDNYYDRLRDMGVKVHTIVGNHTAYYKNTNQVNAVDLLLREYDNVTVYSEPTEVKLGKLPILFIPWINQENEEKTIKSIEKTASKCAMGHLELQGFRVNRQIVMEHGLDSKLFEKFDRVYSGHYHTRSDNGKIFYLGNPYEIYWTDVNDTRGFTIFDTETLEHTHINNPYRVFHNVYYENTPINEFDFDEYENKIVKVIVRKKSDQIEFEKFIDKLYASNVNDLKIVENFQIQEVEDIGHFESEDTFSILDRYIQESEIELDKSTLKNLIREVYQEACEMT